MTRQYVILGASAAGIGAAARLRELDPEPVITVIGEEPHYAYYRPLLPYLIDDTQDPRRHRLLARGVVRRAARPPRPGGRRAPRRARPQGGRTRRRPPLRLRRPAAGRGRRQPHPRHARHRPCEVSHPLRTVDDAEAIGARARDGSAPPRRRRRRRCRAPRRRPRQPQGLGAVDAPGRALHVRGRVGPRHARVVDARVGELVAERSRPAASACCYGHEVAAIIDDADGYVAGVTLDTGESAGLRPGVVGQGRRPQPRVAQTAADWPATAA